MLTFIKFGHEQKKYSNYKKNKNILLKNSIITVTTFYN